jgi:hypothetical protein
MRHFIPSSLLIIVLAVSAFSTPRNATTSAAPRSELLVANNSRF